MKAIITILLDDEDNVRIITDGHHQDLSAMMETAAVQSPVVRGAVIYAVGLMLKRISPVMSAAFFDKFGMPEAAQWVRKSDAA
jgi:hypothetical protein